VNVAIGVGGTFDFYSGKISRAPKFVQKIGLEWLWRLMREPKRIFRIWNATFKFIGFIYKAKYPQSKV
jgi:N-acetylglucosaminyldiphosphoundecaprenol N-acetyl-beta-D-mannosaminyltransferase